MVMGRVDTCRAGDAWTSLGRFLLVLVGQLQVAMKPGRILQTVPRPAPTRPYSRRYTMNKNTHSMD